MFRTLICQFRSLPPVGKLLPIMLALVFGVKGRSSRIKDQKKLLAVIELLLDGRCLPLETGIIYCGEHGKAGAIAISSQTGIQYVE